MKNSKLKLAFKIAVEIGGFVARSTLSIIEHAISKRPTKSGLGMGIAICSDFMSSVNNVIALIGQNGLVGKSPAPA